MCSHLKRKLFEEDGPYHKIWLQDDKELTAVVRRRQLHIYMTTPTILHASDFKVERDVTYLPLYMTPLL